jgi:hypothetical protein
MIFSALLFPALDPETSFILAYALLVTFGLSIVFIAKISMLSTDGVFDIPDGGPTGPDQILRAFTNLGPLPVNPAGTPWSGWVGGAPLIPPRLESETLATPPLSPFIPDPPHPKNGTWTELVEGKRTTFRWAPDPRSITVWKRVIGNIFVALYSLVGFTWGTHLVLNWLRAPTFFPVTPVSGGAMVYFSARTFSLYVRAAKFASKLFVDSPGLRSSMAFSLGLEVLTTAGLITVAGIALNGAVARLYSFSSWWTARDPPGGSSLRLAFAYSLLYVAAALLVVAGRISFESVRPLAQRVLDRFDPDPRSFNEPLDLSLAHLSDLHLTAPEKDKLLDGSPSPNQFWPAILEKLCAQEPGLDAIAITGDQTNAGQPGEWQAFWNGIQQCCPQILQKMIILPGNHDLNLPSPNDIFSAEGPGRALWLTRMLRCLAAIDLIQGERAWVLADGPTRAEDKIVRVRDLIDPIRGELAAFAAEPPQRIERYETTHIPLVGIRQRWVDATPTGSPFLLQQLLAVWRALFPMVIVEPRTNTLIYVLDSNAVGGSVVDNAFGLLTQDTLIILRRLEHHFGARPSVYLLHHHVALPPMPRGHYCLPSKDALLRRFMVLKNATAFLTALPNDRGIVVLHGHRHTRYIGRLDDRIEIVSAPSTTLGDENPEPIRKGRGYFVFSMRKTEANGIRISGADWTAI